MVFKLTLKQVKPARTEVASNEAISSYSPEISCGVLYYFSNKYLFLQHTELTGINTDSVS